MSSATRSAPSTIQQLAKVVSAMMDSDISTMSKDPVGVERKGDKIVLPENMSYKEAHLWLERQERAEESEINISASLECFPQDGILALARAMQEVYGFTDITQQGFWGPVPPTFIQVPTSTGIASAPYGEIKPPKWEGGYLEASIKGHTLLIGGTVRRKFEREAQAIITKTKEILRSSSIYRGQAVQLDLAWMLGQRGFNVLSDAPKFMQLGEAKLILNEVTRFELDTSIFMLIEHTQACKANGISCKHGALLMGTFGVGKTMTAKAIAKKCVNHGWTFMYLKSADQLAVGLKMAKMYAPAVVFVEDIDTVVNERDEAMNEILNTLDGVDTKDAPIITVLTTNKPEDIEPSFLRAGRIDSIIHFGTPDATTAQEFVRTFCGDNLKEGEDLKEVGEALNGLVPAFITEAVNKAKRYTIHRTANTDITGQVTASDLLLAAKSVRAHVEMVKPKATDPRDTILNALEAVNQHGLDSHVHSCE